MPGGPPGQIAYLGSNHLVCALVLACGHRLCIGRGGAGGGAVSYLVFLVRQQAAALNFYPVFSRSIPSKQAS